MPNVLEVVEKLKERLASDVKTVEESKRELHSLKEIATRIVDLETRVDEARTRISRIIRMLGEEQARAILGKSPAFKAHYRNLQKESKYSRSETVSLRAFMEEYLRVVRKAKVAEIVAFLQAIGIEYAKRQTIEAAIRRNPDVLKVTKRNGQKLVSLASQYEL
jgi:hypothetical protein